MKSLRRRAPHLAQVGLDLTGRRPRRSRLTPIKGEDALRAGVILLLVVILTALYPSQPAYDDKIPALGGIAQEEVIAPETFDILKSDPAYTREKEAARLDLPPVLVHASAVAGYQTAAVDSLFGGILVLSHTATSDSLKVQLLRQTHPSVSRVSDASFRYLLRQAGPNPGRLDLLRLAVLGILNEAYAPGVLSSKNVLPQTPRGSLAIRDGEQETIVSLAEIRGLDGIRLSLQEDITIRLPEGSPSDIKAAYEVTDAFLVPSLSYDPEETEARRDEAAKNISKKKGTVLKDERIIDEHEVVTAEHLERLHSLAIHMSHRRQEDPWTPYLRIGAQAVLVGFLVAILFGYLKIFRTPTYNRTSNLVLLGILVLMPTVVAHYAATNTAVVPLVD